MPSDNSCSITKSMLFLQMMILSCSSRFINGVFFDFDAFGALGNIQSALGIVNQLGKRSLNKVEGIPKNIEELTELISEKFEEFIGMSKAEISINANYRRIIHDMLYDMSNFDDDQIQDLIKSSGFQTGHKLHRRSAEDSMTDDFLEEQALLFGRPNDGSLSVEAITTEPDGNPVFGIFSSDGDMSIEEMVEQIKIDAHTDPAFGIFSRSSNENIDPDEVLEADFGILNDLEAIPESERTSAPDYYYDTSHEDFNSPHTSGITSDNETDTTDSIEYEERVNFTALFPKTTTPSTTTPTTNTFLITEQLPNHLKNDLLASDYIYKNYLEVYEYDYPTEDNGFLIQPPLSQPLDDNASYSNDVTNLFRERITAKTEKPTFTTTPIPTLASLAIDTHNDALVKVNDMIDRFMNENKKVLQKVLNTNDVHDIFDTTTTTTTTTTSTTTPKTSPVKGASLEDDFIVSLELPDDIPDMSENEVDTYSNEIEIVEVGDVSENIPDLFEDTLVDPSTQIFSPETSDMLSSIPLVGPIFTRIDNNQPIVDSTTTLAGTLIATGIAGAFALADYLGKIGFDSVFSSVLAFGSRRQADTEDDYYYDHGNLDYYSYDDYYDLPPPRNNHISNQGNGRHRKTNRYYPYEDTSSDLYEYVDTHGEDHDFPDFEGDTIDKVSDPISFKKLDYSSYDYDEFGNIDMTKPNVRGGYQHRQGQSGQHKHKQQRMQNKIMGPLKKKPSHGPSKRRPRPLKKRKPTQKRPPKKRPPPKRPPKKIPPPMRPPKKRPPPKLPPKKKSFFDRWSWTKTDRKLRTDRIGSQNRRRFDNRRQGGGGPTVIKRYRTYEDVKKGWD